MPPLTGVGERYAPRATWSCSAPHQRQILSVPNGIGTDGRFHAHLAYPDPRKRKATIACEDGHVGGSHRSCEWSVQDVYGEC